MPQSDAKRRLKARRVNLQGVCVRAAVALAIAPTVALAESVDDGWRWSVTPYIWGSTIKADVTLPTGQEIGTEVDFDDILDKLDVGAQLHVEGHRRVWGFFVDATWLSMSDDGTRGPIATEAELDTGIYEFAGVYTPGGAAGRFSVFAGARIIDLTLDMTFTGTGPIGTVEERSADRSLTDFMVGGRYILPLGDRWLLNLRGDVGGGDSESSWNAAALLGWRFGSDKDNAVVFGWRHMELDIEDEGVQSDFSMDGPIAGVFFAF